jgi:TfoX/Sxy family transcriptional regulator of competence genes
VAYDEALADRVRAALTGRETLTEREMFGGIAFMIGGNMACGVLGDELIVRLDPEEAEEAMRDTHTRPFDATGRSMKGWLFVSAEGTEREEDLEGWVEAGADHAAALPAK